MSSPAVVLETRGDYELVGPPAGEKGVMIIRCRHCGHPEGGGNQALVRTWWVALTGDATPVHETCPTRSAATD